MNEIIQTLCEHIDRKIQKLQQLKFCLQQEMSTLKMDTEELSVVERMMTAVKSKGDAPTFERGGSKQQQLIAMLLQHGPMSPSEIHKKMKYGWSTVYYLIKKKDSAFTMLRDGRVYVQGMQPPAKKIPVLPASISTVASS